MANETRSVVVKLRAEANGFVVEFNNATRASDRLGHSVDRSSNLISNMFKRIAVYTAAAGLGKLAIDAVKLEATFSKTMAQIAVQTKAPQQELDKLNKLALKLGADTVFSAQDAADAMLELAKGGLTSAQIQAGALSDALTLAAAGGLELGDAADAVVNAMGAFHLKATQTNVAISALAGGANASSADVSDMTEALSQAGQQADSTGLSIADTTGILAAFANNGIKGSDAGTSLKTMLQNLQPQTKRQAEAMAALNLSFVDSQGNFVSAEQIAGRLQTALKGLTQAQRASALQQIFGTDASRAANILANEGAKGIGKYIKASEDQTAAQKLAKASMSGTAGALQQLSGSIETAKIEVGQGLAPVIEDLGNKTADLVSDGDFERWTKQGVAGARDFVREVTPLAVAAGHLAVDVFPTLVTSGKAVVDVLVLGAKVATPLIEAFNHLPKSAQQALVLAAGAKVLSSHMSGLPHLAGASGGGLLAFGANAKKAGKDVEGAGKEAEAAGGRFATLGATIKGNAVLIGGVFALSQLGDEADTLRRSFADADDALSGLDATFSRAGKSTQATVNGLSAALSKSNLGKAAKDLHIDLDALAEDMAKNGTKGDLYRSTLRQLQRTADDTGGTFGGLKKDLLDPFGGLNSKAANARDALKELGDAFDDNHAKAKRLAADTNDLAIDLLFADGKSRGLAARLKALPNRVETKILTPGALKSTDDVIKLARQYKLTPSQVRTVMEAKDFASGDIKKVLALYQKAEKKRKAKVEADTDQAETSMGRLLKALAQFKSKTIHINATTTNTVTTQHGKTTSNTIHGNGRTGSGSYTGGRLPFGLAGGGRVPGIPPNDPTIDNLLGVGPTGGTVPIRSREWVINEKQSDANDPWLGAVNNGLNLSDVLGPYPGYVGGGRVGRQYLASSAELANLNAAGGVSASGSAYAGLSGVAAPTVVNVHPGDPGPLFLDDATISRLEKAQERGAARAFANARFVDADGRTLRVMLGGASL